MNTYTPDWVELNDWILFNAPEVYNATRYLTDAHLQYQCWLTIWERAK